MEMAMTLKIVNDDIKARRSTAIYICSTSLWWTHLESDVIESTRLGLEYRKSKGMALSNYFDKKLSPCGLPLIKKPDPFKFLNNSVKMAFTLSKEHGLDVLIFTHHQNCKKHFFNTYDKYIEVMTNKQ